MKRILTFILVSAFSVIPFTGCQTASAETESASAPISREADGAEAGSPRLSVVTTIFPPYDFVREIAGDRVELTMLLSPGAESHSYDPTPQDIIAIQDCDLFLYTGGDSDLWVERILESADTSGITALPMLDMVEAVEEEIVEGMEHDHDHEDEDDHDEDGDHDHRELDEHVWTSPRNAIRIVEAITDSLCTLDPDNAGAYQSRAADYQAKLAELDARYGEMVDGAARRTVIFGDRFPFRYLADAYGLTYYAAFPGCSTETEASAATVAFLIDKVRDEEIPVVFHIELSNEKMADAICEGTGASKRQLHSGHNVSRDDFAAGITYFEILEQNFSNLKEALN